MLAGMSSFQNAANTGTIRLLVHQLRNDEGNIQVSLYNSREGCPTDYERSYRNAIVSIKDGKGEVTFADLPMGEYAISLIHDENSNGQLDTNFLGMPKEGFGASNDAKATFGPPKYEDAKFTLNQPVLELRIKARYF